MGTEKALKRHDLIHRYIVFCRANKLYEISTQNQIDAEWIDKRSLFIESMLFQLPLQMMYAYRCYNDYSKIIIIDGKNRIAAIQEFLNNEYPLSGLRYFVELNGKYYRDLGRFQQRRIENEEIRICMFETDDVDTINDLFNRFQCKTKVNND